ncbi:hypothetical protein NG798_25835 [Ancylothrix sp. C2]|nr:hypothetical protein [Ancylothrix sp. D3o]
MPVDMSGGLLVAVVPELSDVEPLDVLVGMGGGLLVAVMLGDSTAVVDMDVLMAAMLGDSTVAVDMNMVVEVRLDMGVPVAVDMNMAMDMPGVVLLVVAMVPVDVAYPVVPVDMGETLDIVVPTVADIDNRLGDGGFGMPASMLRNLLLHYHYAVTLIFRWWRVPVLYLHKLSPQ